MKVYDCFHMLNEVDLLNIRLNTLGPLVDIFVIVESTKTFAGREKILYYEKYKDMFRGFWDKIRYIVVDDMPTVQKGRWVATRGRIAYENRWPLEKHQIDRIAEGLKDVNPLDNLEDNPEDIVHISDLDEIPNYESFKNIVDIFKNNKNHTDVYNFYLFEQRFNLLVKNKKEPWCGGFVLRKRLLEGRSIMDVVCTVRKRLHLSKFVKVDKLDINNINRIFGAGFHLSHLSGSFNLWLKFKVQNFSHSESTTGQIPIDTKIDYYELLTKHRDRVTMDFCKKHGINNTNYDMISKKIKENYNVNMDLPKYIVDNLYKFIYLII